MWMKELVRAIQISSLVGSIIFFLGAIFSFLYQEPSQGMLPVIHYPFREVSPLLTFIAIILGLIFVSVTVFFEIRVQSA